MHIILSLEIFNITYGTWLTCKDDYNNEMYDQSENPL